MPTRAPQAAGSTAGKVVGAIGGLTAGYSLWLIAIAIADNFAMVSTWSVLVLLLSGALAVGAVFVGLLMRWRRKYGWSLFAFTLPIPPVALSLALLAELHL